MISSLSIENFALIEKLDINFSNDFSIITGETGAGKSILLDALGLVLGKRADLTSLKDKNEKCIVEAVFSIGKYNLEIFFEENDLDYEEETIIRREILPSGKSRAFINDSPVNLQQLQDLSLYLIDVHSQNQTFELSETDFQFHVIDSIAKNQELIANFQSFLKKYRSSKKKLEEKQNALQNILKEQDYDSFLLDELVSANLKGENQDELEKSYEALNNVEFIRENLDKILAIALEEELGILKNLKELKSTLQKTSSYSDNLNFLSKRVESVLIELDDIVKEIEKETEWMINDPEKLNLLNQKLQNIYNLQTKHQVNSIEALVKIQEELENKVLSYSTLDTEINILEKEILLFENELDRLSILLHDRRREAIPFLTEKLVSILKLLGMPNVRFSIDVKIADSYYKNGKDVIQFLFSANKGSEFGSLKKVASGGEMSRIMLAIKSILSEYTKLATIIFDEIDTGVSGEIAIKMGEIMKDMSQTMQVFAITHLPQIAAKGAMHYKVFKKIDKDKTFSELKLLTQEERITEIAEMLSGKEISHSALNHAKALLN